jgi:hypothetical protein
VTPRKVLLLRETIAADGLTTAVRPVTRVATAVVFTNPYAGRRVHDLGVLTDLGPAIAAAYLPQAAALLPGRTVAYGKAAIVGVHGEVEHGAAVLHPKLGKTMRAVIGGGSAVIPSTCKVAGCGARIDVPLGHKDDPWHFDELDTLTVGLEDAPLPDEIVVILVLADAGRPHPRIASSPLNV